MKHLIKKQEGFTFIELAVIIAIGLVVGAVALGLFLDHVGRARRANITDNINKIKTAMNVTIASKGNWLTDADGDSDYLDELVRIGALSDKPRYPSCSVWYLHSKTDDKGDVSYYLDIDISGCPEDVQKDLTEMDDEIDDGDASTGFIRGG